MSKEYIKAQTPLPAYFPYPKFLLQMSLSHTARLTYVLLLDRMTLSQKNGWVDVQGRAYVLYPLAGLQGWRKICRAAFPVLPVLCGNWKLHG